MPNLHEDRLFPADPATRTIARALYATIRDLPIISPHGHTQAGWFARNEPFPDPATLFVQPDHYVYRMLYSQGIALEDLGIGKPKIEDPRAVWKIFAKNYFLFRGTPSRLWLDYAFENVFSIKEDFSAATADKYFDIISEKLNQPEFLPRALYERFRIALLATTDSPLDSLDEHKQILNSGWKARIIPTYRPDSVVDPDFDGFTINIAQLGELTGEDTSNWSGYLRALENRRAYFKLFGCTATDHGHPSAATADLSADEAAKLYQVVLSGNATAQQRELFRAQMLTEMARMSLADGLVMQIHPGCVRNHNQQVYKQFGRDTGGDIPGRTDYVHALKPLLNRYGNEPGLKIILFTLDETTYSRELAPLAGHYPCLLLGPSWWFHDSPEGMMRFRRNVTETAGFYNTCGFNDDTRAFLSIPARHDVARRVDCAFLASLVTEHRIHEEEAFELVQQLTSGLVQKAYKL